MGSLGFCHACCTVTGACRSRRLLSEGVPYIAPAWITVRSEFRIVRVSCRWLPVELQPELHVSSWEGGRDGSETSAPHGGRWWLVVHLVERVEQLATELEITPL